ncbi:HAUS augmin-like complex subunit 4 [Procambarus clarkii]|uniref:HAUS augmin-like complex subunit 4 n=1 Tax=Procambarus clarkii TaxID=6728 RepID=UPI001E675D58|nr:uncharacterized protein LOC123764215 [Procambarus clarkii]
MEAMAMQKDANITPKTLASQLSGSLPVHVGSEDVNKCPQLAHLLEDLSHRLTPTGMHKTTQTRLTQASYAMKHARKMYLEKATLHRLTQDVLCEASTRQDENAKDLKKLLDGLTLSELQDHLKLAEDTTSNASQEERHTKQDVFSNYLQSQHTVFGITPEQVLSRAEVCVSNKQVEKLADALEERIEQECTRIASFMDPIEFVNYDPDDVAKIPDRLSDVKRKCADERAKLVHSMMQTDCLFQQVYCLLLEYSKVLQDMMTKQRLSQFPAHHTASGIAMCNTHLKKLRCLELELLIETYTSQAVQALKLIHGHLEDRRVRAEKSLTRLEHKMSSYSGLDSKFQDLLKEYSKLQQDIIFTKKSMEEFAE